MDKNAMVDQVICQLITRRIQLGLSQADVADAVGISQSSLAYRELRGFGLKAVQGLTDWAEAVQMDVTVTLTNKEPST